MKTIIYQVSDENVYDVLLGYAAVASPPNASGITTQGRNVVDNKQCTTVLLKLTSQRSRLLSR